MLGLFPGKELYSAIQRTFGRLLVRRTFGGLSEVVRRLRGGGIRWTFGGVVPRRRYEDTGGLSDEVVPWRRSSEGFRGNFLDEAGLRRRFFQD